MTERIDPRVARSRAAVLEAAAALVTTSGLAGLTVEAVVQRSGVARSTIYDRVKAGELTRLPGGKIDTAELLRVFGELHGPPESGDDGDVAAAADASTAWLQELADRQLDQIERLTATVDRQAAELREAEARAERREATWLKQLDALTTKLLPAPEPTPEPPRSFLRRVLGG